MRARNIKPGFFLNDELAESGPYAQLLFAGLWCMADKEGKLLDRPKRIKAEIFPYYEPKPEIEKLLTRLCEKGFITRYVANGLSLIKINNFLDHQRPHHTEKASNFPEPSEITVNSPLCNGEYPPDSLIPDSLIHDSPIATSPPSAPSSREKASPFFSCKHFEVSQEHHTELLKDHPALSPDRLLLEIKLMKDWLDDNPHRHKRNTKGHLKNPKMFIRNWLQRVVVKLEPAAPKEPDPQCPICRGRGREFYEENGEKLVRDCQCLRRET